MVKNMKIQNKILFSVVCIVATSTIAFAGGMTASQVKLQQIQTQKSNVSVQTQVIDRNRDKLQQNTQELNKEREQIEKNIQSVKSIQQDNIDRSFNTFNK